ncbi:hypothetical protein RchiOBHm_Chr7g0196561 [Rosa chinensis]|uniref:Uncharacterized protein n=1 Tax=Rosa chinensis TaxID=74649 RepID=A0A2P6P6M5_ROSCH|nr:hypothetical protein RchiOBHm_Chr7g0196561 [Rosa chinensis]
MRAIATHTQAMHAQSSIVVGMKGASMAMEAMNKVNDAVLAVDNTLFLFFRYHPPDDYMYIRDDPSVLYVHFDNELLYLLKSAGLKALCNGCQWDLFGHCT